MGDIEWYDRVLNFVPSDGREHWAGGVKVVPSEHFTERQDALFAVFIDEFTLDRDPSLAPANREHPLVVQRNGSPWYVTMLTYSGSTQYTDRLYECNQSGQQSLNWHKDPERATDQRVRELKYGARFVVSDWWVWSCDCSTQVYQSSSIIDLLKKWYNAFGNDACFSFDMYMGFWNGKINERRWISLDSTSSSGWRQIHFNGDTPVNRKYSAAPPDPVRIRQKDASGTWRTRLEFSTGLGQDGISTGNVGGNGTYKPFESTCDIKLLLPIVQN